MLFIIEYNRAKLSTIVERHRNTTAGPKDVSLNFQEGKIEENVHNFYQKLIILFVARGTQFSLKSIISC